MSISIYFMICFSFRRLQFLSMVQNFITFFLILTLFIHYQFNCDGFASDSSVVLPSTCLLAKMSKGSTFNTLLPEKPHSLLHYDEMSREEIDRLSSWDAAAVGDLESEAKNYIYGVVQEQQEDLKIQHLCGFFDLIYTLSTLGKCEFFLLHALLEELMECETISFCQLFWPYLESREEQIAHNLSGTRAPGTTLIRLCNSLVRRSSKTSDPRFSGRIAMFLARAFPLSEKSGLNIRGSFNVENVTTYQKSDLTEDQEMGDADAEEKSTENTTSTTSEVAEKSDSKLEAAVHNHVSQDYEVFWSLQDYFRDPTQLLSQSGVEVFKSKAGRVAEILKSVQVKSGKRSFRESSAYSLALTSNAGSKNDVDEEDGEAQFVPKWLTSPDLFELELYDKAFRTTVVAQLFIIGEFLLGLTESAKKRWSAIGAKNNSVMYSFTLDDASAKEIYNIIKVSNLKGVDENFRKVLEAVGSRDIFWQEWKLQNCPPFDPGVMELDGFDAVSRTFEQMKQPRKKFWHALGTPALSKLWKVNTGMGQLESQGKNLILDAEEIYKKVISIESNISKEKLAEHENGNTEDATIISKASQTDTELKSEAETLTWQSLRAARDSGMWSKFGNVDRARGYGGLFQVDEADEGSESSEAEENDEEIVEDSAEKDEAETSEKERDSADDSGDKTPADNPDNGEGKDENEGQNGDGESPKSNQGGDGSESEDDRDHSQNNDEQDEDQDEGEAANQEAEEITAAENNTPTDNQSTGSDEENLSAPQNVFEEGDLQDINNAEEDAEDADEVDMSEMQEEIGATDPGATPIDVTHGEGEGLIEPEVLPDGEVEAGPHGEPELEPPTKKRLITPRNSDSN